jgi:hypothetical protein
VGGNLVLAEALRQVTVGRLLLANGVNGGLRLPRYATADIGSIASPEEALVIWDSDLNVIKVWDGSSYKTVGEVPPVDVYVAGARTTDWTDAGAELEVATFHVAASVWGSRVLRFKAAGRVTTGMTGRVRLYNTQSPGGPHVQLAELTFTNTYDSATSTPIGTAPGSQIWTVKVALVGGAVAPDAFMFGGAALNVT